MIVVLDTNVIVSALLSSKGAPAEIIRRWEAGEFDVAISPPLLSEFERVLNYPRVKKYLKHSDEEIATFLKHLGTTVITVYPQIKLEVIKADPDDDRVLECALEASAVYIVSGNSHLLDLKEYRQIVILNPVEFLAVLNLQS
jgi:putative PIN family toxin of toxin-antitoxin system